MFNHLPHRHPPRFTIPLVNEIRAKTIRGNGSKARGTATLGLFFGTSPTGLGCTEARQRHSSPPPLPKTLARQDHS
jgi:hypothetical protein